MSDDEACGPALPPHMIQKRSQEQPNPPAKRRVLGPQLSDLKRTEPEEDDEDTCGPPPLHKVVYTTPAPTSESDIDREKEWDEVLKKHEESNSESKTGPVSKREEWMTSLPSKERKFE
jgi:hypothetical protein